jgi:hypothetical protein
MSKYMDEMSNEELTSEQQVKFKTRMVAFNHAVMANHATREIFHNQNGVIAPRVMRIQDIMVRNAHNDLLSVMQEINFPNIMPVTLGTLHTLIHAELRERTEDNANEVLDAIANIVRELKFYGEGDL